MESYQVLIDPLFSSVDQWERDTNYNKTELNFCL